MTTSSMPTRRYLLRVLTAAPVIAIAARAEASETLPKVVVMRDPSCGCCAAWADHLRTAGFQVEVVETPGLARTKARLGVPRALASCHTAQVDGYVVEGHVPAGAVKRLLTERPRATGLAVPGMPVGSPGMEVAGVEPDTFEVVLFGPEGQRTFARYRGQTEA